MFQSNETEGSTKMEKEGLIRSLEFLENAGIQPVSIITDRHPQIQKYLREEKSHIQHYYDVWHISKGNISIMRQECITFKIRTTSLPN